MTAENIIEVQESGLQVGVKNDASALSTLNPNLDQRAEASQQIADKFMEFLRTSLDRLMVLWKKAISEEQLETLTLIGIIIVLIPLLTIVIGVVKIINNIPLFSSILELIGLVYFVWFTYRFLLFADTRRELSLKTSNLKQRVIGK